MEVADASELGAFVERVRSLAIENVPGHFWPAKTKYKDPGQPLLLLAALDVLADSPGVSNGVVFQQRLVERFKTYCGVVLGAGVEQPNAKKAFYELAKDGVWTITEGELEVQLAEGVAAALAERSGRDAVRAAVVDEFFSAEAQESLGAASSAYEERRSPLQRTLEDILSHYGDEPLSSPLVRGSPMFGLFERANALLQAAPPVAERPQLVVTWSAGTANRAEIPWITLFDGGDEEHAAAGWQCALVFQVGSEQPGVFMTIGRRQASGYTRALRFTTLSDAQARLGAKTAEGGVLPFHFYAAGAVPQDDAIEQDLAEMLAAYDGVVEAERVKAAPSKEQLFAELQAMTHLSEAELQDIELALETKRQLIFEGPPGSGKTYVADLFARYFTGTALDGPAGSRVVTVQFHQSYGYEDFVQGIRPLTGDNGAIEYRVQDGIFKRLCGQAAQAPRQRFAIIVDEINRGNLSRIFGELLLLLEYRDKSIVLPYDPEGPLFSIPPNVYVIGTMNTADRSLAQIDYALRRRFNFYRLRPTSGGEARVLAAWLKGHVDDEVGRERALRVFLALNKRLREELGEDFEVGHSYFMTVDIGAPEGLDRIWRWSVMPLLEEYFHGRRDRAELLASFGLDALG